MLSLKRSEISQKIIPKYADRNISLSLKYDKKSEIQNPCNDKINSQNPPEIK